MKEFTGNARGHFERRYEWDKGISDRTRRTGQDDVYNIVPGLMLAIENYNVTDNFFLRYLHKNT